MVIAPRPSPVTLRRDLARLFLAAVQVQLCGARTPGERREAAVLCHGLADLLAALPPADTVQP